MTTTSHRRARVTGPARIDVVTEPTPVRRSDAVRCEVIQAGICGTDLSIVKDGAASPSQVLGHEILARVLQSPPDSSWLPGERVMVRPIIGCEECWYCLRGLAHLCDHSRDLTISYGRPGGFSDLLDVLDADRGTLVGVADGVADDDAVWAEPLAVGVRAARHALAVDPGSVVVVGAGPVGLCVTAALAAYGVEVIVVEPRDGRRHAARQVGAAAALSPEEPAARRRHDCVVASVGGAPGIQLATDAVCPGGRLVCAGLGHTEVSAVPTPYDVVTSFGYLEDEFTESTRLINDGRVRLGALVTHRFALPDIAAAMVASATDPDAVKVVVVPGAGESAPTAAARTS